MTLAPERPPVEVASLEEAFAVLRAAGYRVTAARRLVLEALFAAEGPVSAEQIASGLGGRLSRSDLPTTYRNLEALEALGLVRHFHLGHGPGLYVLVGERELEYLACERCGRVTSVDPAALDPVREQIRAAFGYETSFRHFPLLGRCHDCAAGGHVRHEHEHSHGDLVHSHPHSHEPGSEHDHHHRHG